MKRRSRKPTSTLARHSFAATMIIGSAMAQEPAPPGTPDSPTNPEGVTAASELAPAISETAPAAFEAPPVFDATTQLPPELLRGPHHRVRAAAPSDGYLTHYTIDSDFGVFHCAGRRELERRVTELGAISKLVEVSKSDLFAEGLRRSIEEPIDAVKAIVDKPVESVKAVPSTVGHFFAKVGSSVGNTAKRVGRRIGSATGDDLTDGSTWAQTGANIGRGARSVVGFDKAKLDTARQLGVDPYSDNQRLQEEIEKVTWAFFAGGTPLRIVGIATGASIALTATQAVGLPADIYDVTPAELALRDRRNLETMGISPSVSDAVLINPAISVSTRHAMVGHLSQLPGRGRAEVALAASTLDSALYATFLTDALAGLVERHQASPFADVKMFGRLPAGVHADGTIEVFAPVDHVSWTEQVAGFAQRDDFPAARHLRLAGTLSEAARRGFEAAGWTIVRD